jgi:DNA mismatch endonuclease (patch repair protein)
MDSVTPARRSEIMARVRSRDTKPEMVVRRLVHAMGYRYRLHARDLPGKPDLVFRSREKVVFIHGCFWHRHAGCALARLPTSRQDFWLPKLNGNRQRDAKNERALRDAGWDVLTIWECELGDIAELKTRIRGFLDA